MSFYSNTCKLLSTLHGGIKHQRPSVKLPLSKVRKLHCSLLPFSDVRPQCMSWRASKQRQRQGVQWLPVIFLTLGSVSGSLQSLWSSLQQRRKHTHPHTAVAASAAECVDTGGP